MKSILLFIGLTIFILGCKKDNEPDTDVTGESDVNIVKEKVSGFVQKGLYVVKRIKVRKEILSI